MNCFRARDSFEDQVQDLKEQVLKLEQGKMDLEQELEVKNLKVEKITKLNEHLG